MAIVPADKPKYLFLTLMDEPQALPETDGYRTAAWNSGPVTGKIIERVGPLLGVPPRFELPTRALSPSRQTGLWDGQHPPDRRKGALMRLAELLPGADIPAGLDEQDITALTCDSRRATPGSLFFAVPGSARRRPRLCARRRCGRARSRSSPEAPRRSASMRRA